MIQTWLGSSGTAELFKRALSRVSRLEESFVLSRKSVKTDSRVWGRLSWILLMVLVVGAVFIPRIPLGGFSRYYSLDLKIEDLVLAGLLAVFFLFRPAETLSPWRHAVESSFLCFLLAASLSIPVGMMTGTLDKPLMSVLYLMKWFEYFLIFFFSVRVSQAVGGRRMVQLFFWLGLVLAAYGYYEHFEPVSKAAYPNYYRLFERPPFHGDANHIGGLLAMWLAFFSCLSLRLSAAGEAGQTKILKWVLPVSIVFVFFPFIWTFSRKSYLAFAGAYFFLFFLVRGARRRWIFMACVLVCAGLLLPTRLAERVSDLGEVMSAADPYHSSWAGNMDVWKRCFWNFDRFWLFGAGLGARHRLFYESQYVMTLTETGVVGLSALMAVLLVPAVYALRRLRTAGPQGLFAGAWLSAWAAFMIHNLSCVSLTVSKCAVVWWFLTGAFVGAMEPRKNA